MITVFIYILKVYITYCMLFKQICKITGLCLDFDLAQKYFNQYNRQQVSGLKFEIYLQQIQLKLKIII